MSCCFPARPRAIAAAVIVAALIAALTAPKEAAAHGFAGKRFFPATISTEDPFVADELSMPTVSSDVSPASGEEPKTRETEIAVEWAKRLTEDLGVSIGQSVRHLDPKAEPSESGLGNLELGLKYKLFQSDAHETVVSAGLSWELGGSGARRVGADRFSTLAPTLYFGQGLGDLSDWMALFRPIAITGAFDVTLPLRGKTSRTVADPDTGEIGLDFEKHPNVFEWGLAVEYSLPYLQSAVRDVGLGAPFNRMVPLVEFAFQTPVNRGSAGATTGTINPGILWAGQSCQLALEAIIPVNNRSGGSVGAIGQLHFFLDDIFPTTLGKPLF